MQAIRLIHRSVLVPAVAVLDEIGAPTETMLRREGLPVFESASAPFVSMQSAFAFSQAAADSQGFWDFGFRAAEQSLVGNAARWGPRVATAVTLRHAIQIMESCAELDLPGIRIGLEESGTRQWFWRQRLPGQQHWPGFWIAEQYMLGLMIQMVRMTEGPDWCPDHLTVNAPESAWAFKRPDFAREAKVEFCAPRTSIELPIGSLDRRLPTAISDSNQEDRYDPNERPAVDLQGSLHQVLKSLADERKLTLELGAALSRGSTRSLQRALARYGTSWREVVDQVQLETAIELMHQPTNTLANIAAKLGYSQYAHFYRAFRRWTGISPGEYRKGLNR